MNTFRNSVLAACVLLAGCISVEVPTDASTFNVDPQRLAHLKLQQQTVALRNGYAGSEKVNYKINNVTWVLDQEQFTNTAIAMMGRALEKQGVKVSPSADKVVTLRVRVLGAGLRTYPFVAVASARVGLEVNFAGGGEFYVESENGSPGGATRAFDGAVLFTLNQLLEDPKFAAYMNR